MHNNSLFLEHHGRLCSFHSLVTDANGYFTEFQRTLSSVSRLGYRSSREKDNWAAFLHPTEDDCKAVRNGTSRFAAAHKVAWRGSKELIECCRAEDPTIEFFQMPARSSITSLFRFSDTAKESSNVLVDNDDWAPLMIRSSTESVFLERAPRYDCGWVGVSSRNSDPSLTSTNNSLTLYLVDKTLSDLFSQIQIGTNRSHKSKRLSLKGGNIRVVSPCELIDQLRVWWLDLPHAPRDEWIARSMSASSDSANFSVLNQLQSLVYKPLGLHLGYPHWLDAPGFSHWVGPYKVVHRCAVQQKISGGYKVELKKRFGRRKRKFCTFDEFDFLIVMIPAEEDGTLIRGVYWFPKGVLSEHGLLSNDVGTGKSSFVVRLPDQPCIRPSYDRLRAWQKPYYVGLDDSTDEQTILTKVRSLMNHVERSS